ncbi:MAG: 1-acyl-sn-glycerol-3-phosphate acyltransferase [Crocinitomicaceae bacterium]|nr:1-acyl-sn-glycerol-3-phosphate acyltransferase [Crocinitomicaceae bacterium]
MRILYFLSKITVAFGLRLYFSGIKLVNAPKKFFGRTIYVSNHPASFMDPIAIGAFQHPIVFFMTRADVFNKFSKPFLWASHMLPIYRQHDGEDTREKNEEVFEKCKQILSFGRNLLLFGEGFTDDVFIRRLKPVKKGAVKIGFQTLVKMNWKKKVYMAAIGCNYTDPNTFGSGLLMSVSDRICLNDYKELFEENESKAITEVTRLIEQMMQDQITHVQNVDNAEFHEQIMMVTRKGMNVHNYDHSYSLKQRWLYSKRLATWLNSEMESPSESMEKLKDELQSYFKLLKRFKIEEYFLHWKMTHPSGSRIKEILLMILLFPFAVVGTAHLLLPYLITKKYVEGSFKRTVFWGSTKVLVGGVLAALFNGVFIYLFYHYVYPSWWLSIGYFFSIGVFGLLAYNWFKHLKHFVIKGKVNKTDLSTLIKKREEIQKNVEALVPNSFD